MGAQRYKSPFLHFFADPAFGSSMGSYTTGSALRSFRKASCLRGFIFGKRQSSLETTRRPRVMKASILARSSSLASAGDAAEVASPALPPPPPLESTLLFFESHTTRFARARARARTLLSLVLVVETVCLSEVVGWEPTERDMRSLFCFFQKRSGGPVVSAAARAKKTLPARAFKIKKKFQGRGPLATRRAARCLDVASTTPP